MPLVTSIVLPQLGAAPIVPVTIDAGVDYKFVVPVSGETSLAFTPVPGFTIELDGRTLTLNYSATAPAADTTFSIPVTASNNDGEVTKNYSVRVRGSAPTAGSNSFYAGAGTSSANFSFNSDRVLGHQGPQPIQGKIKVGTKIKYVSNLTGIANTSSNVVINTAYYVVSVNDALGLFKISGTSGGSPIAPDGVLAANFVIANAVNTLPEIFVGDTSRLTINQPVTFAYGNGDAIPSNFSGTKYIKTIVDAYRITVASTVGGATVNSNADAFPADENTSFIVDSPGYRYFPAITSDPEFTATEETPIDDYVATTDLDGDDVPPTFAVLHLPRGLSFDAATATISGTPFNLSAQTRVVLIAYKGSNASYRYLLINSATAAALDADVVFDIGPRRFYSVNGPAGRADRIEHYLNDPPIRWGFEQNGAPFTVPASSVVNFWIKTAINAATALTSGTKTLTVDCDIFDLGEDWTLAALVALFSQGQKYVDLICQLELRLPGDGAGRYRKATIPFRLWNDEAQAGTGATGTAPSVFTQSKPLNALTGGTSLALDAVVTTGLAVDTWLAEVVRDVGGGTLSESRWFLVTGTDAEDTDAGIVRPDDYNVGTNPKVWKRVSGL